MTPEELYKHIEKLINKKTTHPRLLSFADLKCSTSGDPKILRESFKELVRTKRIRVREGKNSNLIEIQDENN